MPTHREIEALEYHEGKRPGKLEVVPSKPCLTQRDLSLAYTPGVAVPCLAIEADPETAYRYTGRGNLVAVVSNGTAVLGLGAIGALAGKPVMEGKAVLFKRFAGIDVFDLEIDERDPARLIAIVQALEPTFGGINLEDIKAPECFQIEETLRATMHIPVFHDDQHGTAIISGAALLNALEITGRRIGEVRAVVCGAGAAGIACARMFVKLGGRRENLLLVDSEGVVTAERAEHVNPYKRAFAAATAAHTLADALVGADVLIGVSTRDVVTPAMLLSMAPRPIVFAMANPDPEIAYELARATRDDVILATGRSDFPNQVNNVLGFPFIFRGALDARATTVTDEMELAAVKALAALAKEDVPDQVMKAYGIERLRFGPDYLIPKPFDPRVLLRVAPAVAVAATLSGVARRPVQDAEAYAVTLERFLGRSREVMRVVIRKARKARERILFPEAEEEKILRAAVAIREERIAQPILVGDEAAVREKFLSIGVDPAGWTIVNPATHGLAAEFADELYRLRQRKGMTPMQAAELVRQPHVYALLMLRRGLANGLVAGLNRSYAEVLRPALRILGLQPGVRKVAGMYLVVLPERVIFFADATVNIEPDSEELAEIALLGARTAQRIFDVQPRVAMLSFANFGNVRHPFAERVARAVEIVRRQDPDLVIDGEMAVDTALVPDLARGAFPHSRIQGDANVLIFPDLQSGNIAYKLMQNLAGAEVIGPILMGLNHPVNLLNHYSSVSEIVNLTALTAVTAEMSARAASSPADLPVAALEGAR